jgi:glycine cleavage system transcriptional repressor
MSNALNKLTHKRVVISGIGPDQPGIVASVSEILYRHDANIEDSTMTQLADEFAIILLVSLPSTAIDALQAELWKLESSHGLVFVVKPAPDIDTLSSGHGSSQAYMISVTGNDRTGITHRVSRALADLKVNITDLNAQVIDGEDGPLYIMMIEALFPANVEAKQVRQQLKPLAEELCVEIQVRPLEALAL